MTFGRNENNFQDDFLKYLRMNGAYAVAIAGGLYVSGQPDITVTSKFGAVTMVELKVHRAISVPTRENILSLLRGPQINVITNQLWRRNSHCLIIAQIAAKPDTCCILSPHKLSLALWLDTCKVLANLEYGVRSQYYT